MEFTIKSGSPEKQRSACVVVGVFDNRKPSLSAELIDRGSGGYVSEIIRRSDLTAGEAAAARGLAIAHGMDLARDLGNLPANICTPTYLAERAQALAKELDFSCQVLDRPQLEELKMGSFLSVTNGSEQPPKFIVLEYNGAGKKQKPLVLVGKGSTVDTGGISIKHAPDMDHMKSDR